VLSTAAADLPFPTAPASSPSPGAWARRSSVAGGARGGRPRSLLHQCPLPCLSDGEDWWAAQLGRRGAAREVTQRRGKRRGGPCRLLAPPLRHPLHADPPGSFLWWRRSLELGEKQELYVVAVGDGGWARGVAARQRQRRRWRDGASALLELRRGRAAIHFLSPFLLMARRRWVCGPRRISSLRHPFESPVPWSEREFPVGVGVPRCGA
jgi:hypothetical protein